MNNFINFINNKISKTISLFILVLFAVVLFPPSTSASITWNTEQLINGGSGSDATGATIPSVKVDSNGDMHVAYFYFNDVTGVVEARYATNISGSWQYETIDSWTDYGFYFNLFHKMHRISLDLDANEKAHVAYTHTANNSFLRYATNSSGSWNITSSFGGSNADVFYPAISVDLAGGVHIGAQDRTSADAIYLYRDPSSGSWNTTTVDSSDTTGVHLDLEASTSGVVHMVYVDSQGLNYATKSAGNWSVQVVESTGRYPAVTVDNNGLPRIAYMSSQTTPRLRHASYNGSSWSISGDLDDWTDSIDIGVDEQNMSLISYMWANHEVKFAQQTSGGTWDISEVVEGTNYHRYPSVAYGNGLRNVFYIDHNYANSMYHASEEPTHGVINSYKEFWVNCIIDGGQLENCDFRDEFSTGAIPNPNEWSVSKVGNGVIYQDAGSAYLDFYEQYSGNIKMTTQDSFTGELNAMLYLDDMESPTGTDGYGAFGFPAAPFWNVRFKYHINTQGKMVLTAQHFSGASNQAVLGTWDQVALEIERVSAGHYLLKYHDGTKTFTLLNTSGMSGNFTGSGKFFIESGIN